MKKTLITITALLCIFTYNVASYKPMEEFKSDGCSMFPDGNYRECCVNHDIAYFSGGTIAQRTQADAELYMCVKQKHSKELATLMYMGVRIGGTPLWPTSFRWGFGRDYSSSIFYQ